MLIVALVLAVIGLAALVTAVVTSNELIAWVCIGASVIGVLLLVVDAVRERASSRETSAADEDEDASAGSAEDYPEQPEPPSAAHPAPDAHPASADPTPEESADASPPSPAGEGGKPGTADAAKPE